MKYLPMLLTFYVAATPLIVQGQVIINEIHASPRQDYNGDTLISSRDDEYIELLNVSSMAIDLSGHTISDLAGIRHEFPSGSILPAGHVLTVFGGGAVSGIPGRVQVASSGQLGLNNSGDEIAIHTLQGELLTQVVYGNEGSYGVALHRTTPADALVRYSAIDGTNLTGSPGRSTFGDELGTLQISPPAQAGWYFVGVASATFDLVGSPLPWPTQGFAGATQPSGDPNVFTFDDAGNGYQPPGAAGVLDAGSGFLYYAFDAQPTPLIMGGGEPETVTVDLAPHAPGASHAGFYLLGNPFRMPINASILAMNQRPGASNWGYTWRQEAGGQWHLIDLTEASTDVIEAGAAWFVYAPNGGALTYAAHARTIQTGQKGARVQRGIRMALEAEGATTVWTLQFHPEALAGWDAWDAPSIARPDGLPLAMTSSEGPLGQLAVDSRPQGTYEIPLTLQYPIGSSASLQVSMWDVPEGITLSLRHPHLASPIGLDSSYVGTLAPHLNSAQWILEVVQHGVKTTAERELFSRELVHLAWVPNPATGYVRLMSTLPSGGMRQTDAVPHLARAHVGETLDYQNTALLSGSQVSFVDVLGRSVYTQRCPDGMDGCTMDVSHFRSGVYFAHLTTADGTLHLPPLTVLRR